MNTDLIKQLRLAIEVEEGKVPMGDIQRRLKHEYISRDKTQMEWSHPPGWDTPESWNHKEYEYRRKPKPLECWVAEYDSCLKKLLWDENQEPISRPKDAGKLVRLVKMREVTND